MTQIDITLTMQKNVATNDPTTISNTVKAILQWIDQYVIANLPSDTSLQQVIHTIR